jgi:hypothetical protein
MYFNIHSGSCAPAERDLPSLATIFSQALSRAAPSRCQVVAHCGDLVGVQDRASPNHAVNVPCMADIALRIGVQDQQIGAFSRFESAQIGSAAHGAGAALGRGLKPNFFGRTNLTYW